MYPSAYEKAVAHSMIYEVGGFFKLTPEVEAGLIDTPAQRKAVGYVDDPLDRGGETKFGVAKNANPDLDITNLTWSDAEAVYYDRYWVPGICDRLDPRVGVLHFDCCVNHGVGRAKKFLQRAVGVDDDGIIGKVTLAALQSMDPVELCNKVCDVREQFYRDIVTKNPSQSRFLNGWLRRVNEMRAYTTDTSAEF
jgi:lysozyme family protein